MTNSDSGTGITIEDLRSFNFKHVLSRQSDDAEKSEARTCQRYSKSFVEESKLAVSEGNTTREEICDLFATFTSSFYFDDDVPEPFPPPDIDKDHLELLKQFVSEIQDPELRARIADILWTLRVDRAFQFAELAVDSYIEAAAGFDRAEASHHLTDRLERALQIAAALGKNGSKYDPTIAFIETELVAMKAAGILRGPAHLLKLLCEHGKSDPSVFIPYATQLAEEFERKNAWEAARIVWYIARDWHLLAKDNEGARCAERRAAMTYEPEAIGWMKLSTNSHVQVTDLLQRGLVALRQSGAPEDDIDRVHALLLERQASHDDFKELSVSTNISELVESTKHSFRDRPLVDCIYGLASNFRPPSIERLKEQANELQAKHPMQYLITMQLLDEQGKVIGKRPGNTLDDRKGSDESIRLTMYQQAKYWQRLVAISIILPALDQINLDHHISPRDLVGIVANSLFIPPDRQHIFLRGLYHGFKRDFMVASSLLVPQIENSLRYVLQQHGVITSKLDSEGIQEEYSLRRLLYDISKVKEIFGQDLLFDLQGLLHERLGSNFRNRLAHGLVTDNEYASWPGAYSWGLVLYLCCAPLLARQAAAQNTYTADDDMQQPDDEEPDSDLV